MTTHAGEHAGEEALARLRALAASPLVVAPMAGGPSTPELVVAASQAGAFGFLAGGYKRADELRADMTAVGAAGIERFGVNLFVPGAPTNVPDRLDAYLTSLGPLASLVGAAPGAPVWDDDDYPRKLELLVATPPAAVSFTFGVPAREIVRELQHAGAVVMVTVTTPEEAALGSGRPSRRALPPRRGGRGAPR